jgi:hypothetical protein
VPYEREDRWALAPAFSSGCNKTPGAKAQILLDENGTTKVMP